MKVAAEDLAGWSLEKEPFLLVGEESNKGSCD